MKRFLCGLVAAIAIVALSASNAEARGGRGGGNMMVCNVTQAPAPPQAAAANLQKVVSTRVLTPMSFSLPAVAKAQPLNVDLNALQAIFSPPDAEVVSKIANK